MKLDKETVIKQQFWFLLMAYVPLVLIALIMLWTSVAGAIEEKRKKVESAEKALSGIKDPKNDSWIAALQVRQDKVAEKKEKIWKNAWEVQKAFMTWPTFLDRKDNSDYYKAQVGRWPDSLTVNNDKPFGELIKERVHTEFAKELYAPQVHEFITMADPVNEKMEGVVQYQGGWENLFVYVQDDEGKPGFKHVPPTSEELWLAEEDIWVQRELLRIIKNTNDLAATFKQVSGPPLPLNKDKDEVARRVFTSATWKLDLVLAKPKDQTRYVARGTITNLSNRKQVLSIPFEIRFLDVAEPEYLFAEAEPLAPNATADIKETSLKILREPRGVESVKQIYDWRTAPVKRIDKLVFARAEAFSHRTDGLTLLARKFPTESEGGDTVPAPSADPGLASKLQSTVAGGGSSRVSGATNRTPNGLEKNRYVDLTAEVRRMPVGLVLVIDQDHIQDLLTEVANSRLRIQTTQMYWQHFSGKIKPEGGQNKIMGPTPSGGPDAKMKEGRRPAGSEKFAGGPGAIPGTRPAGREGPPRPSGTPGLPGMLQGTGMGEENRRMFQDMPGKLQGGMAAASAAAEEYQPNLMELAVYGIASIYERYPDKPASGDKAAKEEPKSK